MTALPYITAPGNIEKALTGIKSAATPPRVNQDFVKTILKIPGGSGDQVTSYLKKIGFVNQDGTPSDIYKRFRNTATAGVAAAQALKFGYAPLYIRNEYMHQLPDEKLKGLIIEETGQQSNSSVVGLVLTAIKAIKKHADWSEPAAEEVERGPAPAPTIFAGPGIENVSTTAKSVGLNLSYTINLNLPSTSDVAVFNAIFKSLKENLLKNE
jgi:hypothetical protein